MTIGGCLSPVRGFCAAAGECDEDNASVFLGGFDAVGSSDDSVEVCTAGEEGRLRSLRANEEPECAELARALEVYYACVGQAFSQGDECDALTNPGFTNGNPCEGEIDDISDALRDISGDECDSDEE